MPFMTHPDHGATNVSSGEVEAHEAIGWKISTHAEWMALKQGKYEQPAQTAQIRKAGRKAQTK